MSRTGAPATTRASGRLRSLTPFSPSTWSPRSPPLVLTTKIILPGEYRWDATDKISTVLTDSTVDNLSNIIYADHDYGNNDGRQQPDRVVERAPRSRRDRSSAINNTTGISGGLAEATNIYDIVALDRGQHITTGGSTQRAPPVCCKTTGYRSRSSGPRPISRSFAPAGCKSDRAQSDDSGQLLISSFSEPHDGQLRHRADQQFDVALHGDDQSQRGLLARRDSLGDVGHAQSGPTAVDPRHEHRRQLHLHGPRPEHRDAHRHRHDHGRDVKHDAGRAAGHVSIRQLGRPLLDEQSRVVGHGLHGPASTNGTTWTALRELASSSTYTYTDTGLSANTQYYYQVIANNGTVDSNVAAAMTLQAPPTNLTGTYQYAVGTEGR